MADEFHTWIERRIARERDRCAVVRVLGARGELDRAVALVNESEEELQTAIAAGIVRTCSGCSGSGSRERIVTSPGSGVLDPSTCISTATVQCQDCGGFGLVPGGGAR